VKLIPKRLKLNCAGQKDPDPATAEARMVKTKIRARERGGVNFISEWARKLASFGERPSELVRKLASFGEHPSESPLGTTRREEVAERKEGER